MSDFARLVANALEGEATPAELRELGCALDRDGGRCHEYVQQMRVHALLLWRAGQEPQLALVPRNPPTPALAFPPRWLALAAALAILAAIWVVVWPRVTSQSALVLVEVLQARGAILAGTAPPLQAGERRPLRRLDLQAGEVRLALPSGAVVAVEAPACLEFLDAMQVRVLEGRITADAEAAHGFTILTPGTKVVDLGTRFGVEVAGQQSEVVVFDGAVELQDHGGTQRLEQGEAVRWREDGPKRPLVSIAAGREPDEWRSGAGGVFREVRDNRCSLEARKFYQVVPGGLQEDTRAYVDRPHEWNGVAGSGLPEFLVGADLVRTFNDDKRDSAYELTVELRQAATLYLFLDRKPIPAWVTRTGFVDTGREIGLDEGPSAHHGFALGRGAGVSVERAFSVWKLEVAASQPIILGPPREGPTGAKAMYGLAAVPRDHL